MFIGIEMVPEDLILPSQTLASLEWFRHFGKYPRETIGAYHPHSNYSLYTLW
jgi:hypothetical protein